VHLHAMDSTATVHYHHSLYHPKNHWRRTLIRYPPNLAPSCHHPTAFIIVLAARDCCSVSSSVMSNFPFDCFSTSPTFPPRPPASPTQTNSPPHSMAPCVFFQSPPGYLVLDRGEYKRAHRPQVLLFAHECMVNRDSASFDF
jgi:hypothetical protein